jgi:hypothetical protein
MKPINKVNEIAKYSDDLYDGLFNWCLFEYEKIGDLGIFSQIWFDITWAKLFFTKREVCLDCGERIERIGVGSEIMTNCSKCNEMEIGEEWEFHLRKMLHMTSLGRVHYIFKYLSKKSLHIKNQL